jgi:hypothetical protein
MMTLQQLSPLSPPPVATPRRVMTVEAALRWAFWSQLADTKAGIDDVGGSEARSECVDSVVRVGAVRGGGGAWAPLPTYIHPDAQSVFWWVCKAGLLDYVRGWLAAGGQLPVEPSGGVLTCRPVEADGQGCRLPHQVVEVEVDVVVGERPEIDRAVRHCCRVEALAERQILQLDGVWTGSEQDQAAARDRRRVRADAAWRVYGRMCPVQYVGSGSPMDDHARALVALHRDLVAWLDGLDLGDVSIRGSEIDA